jgi:hypothetical protein
MRKTYHAQLPLTSANAHPRAAELCAMSAVLDANIGVLRRVHADLLRVRKAGGCKPWARRVTLLTDTTGDYPTYTPYSGYPFTDEAGPPGTTDFPATGPSCSWSASYY